MSLKDDTQPNSQPRLDCSPALTGEAREAGRAETESSGATNGLESPASTDRLMEEVCERENLKEALRRGEGEKKEAGGGGGGGGGDQEGPPKQPAPLRRRHIERSHRTDTSTPGGA